MKSALIALLAFCLCLPLMGDDTAKKNFERTKALAEQGNASFQTHLGWMYQFGKGVQKDDKEALKWYRNAAEQGFIRAQYSLAACYFHGQGVLKDNMTAYAWINIAEANGHAIAKKNKGVVAKKMTPDQIAKAQELSKEMINKNPKLLNK